METLTFSVNGKEISVEIEPDEMLAGVLRDRLGLIGTKIACGEGECGACTVLVDGVSYTSCIFPAMKAQGRKVLTVDGLSDGVTLHPIQEAFVEETAAQCGYCTPGFIMSTKALLDQNPRPSHEEILTGLSGNLCRCTGYYQIVRAVERAAEKLSAEARR